MKILKNFLEDGYVIIPNFYSEDDLLKMDKEAQIIEEIASRISKTSFIFGSKIVIPYERKENDDSFLRAEWITHIAPKTSNILISKQVKNYLKTITNYKRFDKIICQLNTKMPQDGVSYSWHQDVQTDKGDWKNKEYVDKYIMCASLLTDNTLLNGAMRVLKGSHKLGHISKTISKSDVENIYKYQYPEVVLESKRGDAIFFSPYLLHMSLQNNDIFPRRLILSGYACEKTYTRKNYFSCLNF